MEEWVKFVRDVGVPAGVAFFVLWRVDARLMQLVIAVKELQVEIGKLLIEILRRA